MMKNLIEKLSRAKLSILMREIILYELKIKLNLIQ